MGLRVLGDGEVFAIGGEVAKWHEDVAVVNRFLAHLQGRNFARATRRAYAYDVLNFLRFLVERGVALIDTPTGGLVRLPGLAEASQAGGGFDRCQVGGATRSCGGIVARLASRAEAPAEPAALPPVEGLNDAQRAAVAVLAGQAKLMVVEGAAGAGKTTTLAAAKTAAEARGHRMLVVTPT